MWVRTVTVGSGVVYKAPDIKGRGRTGIIRKPKCSMRIVLEEKTFIFSFLTLQLIEQVETAQNPLGLCGIATNERAVSKVIALPNPTKGSIKVLNYGK